MKKYTYAYSFILFLRWSLFIDPQGQANKWIKNLEKVNNLEVLKLSMNYIKKMEACIEQGRPVLIECILEELDSPLDPILMKQTFMQGEIFCFVSVLPKQAHGSAMASLFFLLGFVLCIHF